MKALILGFHTSTVVSSHRAGSIEVRRLDTRCLCEINELGRISNEYTYLAPPGRIDTTKQSWTAR